MRKLYLLLSVMLLSFMVSGCVLDKIDKKLDAKINGYFDKHPERIAKVYAATSKILDQFDSPPTSTVGAGMQLVGVKINIDELSPAAQDVLRKVAGVVEPVIKGIITAVGIEDKGRVARLVGRAFKRINRVAQSRLPSVTYHRSESGDLIVRGNSRASPV